MKEYYKLVPTDPVENVQFRIQLIKDCAENPVLRAGIYEMCKQDICFYINAFGWQVNPKHVGHEVGPFILWQEQIDALKATAHRLWVLGKDVIWEKSREWGATWLALFLKDHSALFFKYRKFLAFSHTMDAVDLADDPDSLFWKVQFMHDHLPDWITRGAAKKKIGILSYPYTKSAFSGKASTKRTGVGGRATSIFSDETAKQESAEAIIGQTRDTGPRLFVSTHYGVTAFYALTKRPDAYKLLLHWSSHPEKKPGLYRSFKGGYEIIDKEYKFPKDYKFVTDGKPFGGPYPGIRSVWYDTECKERQSDRDVAMHLDIDPEGAAEQFFDQAVIHAIKEDRGFAPDWEGEILVTGEARLESWCERRGGPIRIWGFRPGPGVECPAGRYGAGADVSQGTEATPSVLSLGNANTREKVLEFVTNRMEPYKFGDHVVALCRWFKNAKLVWEIPGPGLSMAKRIIVELGYSNIYYNVDEAPHTMVPVFSDRPGWINNPKSKLLLLTEYKHGLQNRVLMNRSIESLQECLPWRYIAGGYVEHPGERGLFGQFSGSGVSHGDIVIADALMWKILLDLGLSKLENNVPVEEIKQGSWAWRRRMLEELDRLQEEGEELPEYAHYLR